jgi:hypothetical protein
MRKSPYDKIREKLEPQKIYTKKELYLLSVGVVDCLPTSYVDDLINTGRIQKLGYDSYRLCQ